MDQAGQACVLACVGPQDLRDRFAAGTDACTWADGTVTPTGAASLRVALEHGDRLLLVAQRGLHVGIED